MAIRALRPSSRARCGYDSSDRSGIRRLRLDASGRLTLPGSRAGCRVSQILVDERDRHAALAHGCRNAFDGPRADVTAGEDSGNARLEEVGVAFERPDPGEAHVWPGEHVAALVECDLGR